ncbi:MAG: alternative ribosome rescue aminoacyl-tRNA hydrolase ArfB [bacterium]|nr:alternative ribosome rescue aminoacyl-tRNA hydrolase ArfB [bacterium]MDE0352519.1 alternative ribosome rescue aminoacyl-tRNA hydrolase ArfB [bacterium]
MAAESKRDLRLRRGPVVPARELRWDFGPASGPGGQHANRSNTRVGLTLSVTGSPSFTDAEKRRIEGRLGARMVSGTLRVVADDHRSQWRNRQEALRRMAALLDSALAPEPPVRRATKPGRSAQRKRLEAKRRRSATKRLRRPPRDE